MTMKARPGWLLPTLTVLLLAAGCSSPTSESQTEEQRFRASLAALSVALTDVTQEGSERYLNPLSFLTAELRDNWVYHLSYQFQLKTGDTGTLTLDAQFTDNGRAIPVPTALNRNPVLNLDARYEGTFKGQPIGFEAELQLRTPASRVVALSGSGTLGFADLSGAFSMAELTLDFNALPLPRGVVNLQISQPDFGNWTGTATFEGTAVVHVVATNGTRTIDLHINLLTGDIS
jgi:hypothetical protein